MTSEKCFEQHLNCSVVILNQERYSYRHDCILHHIQKCLDTTKYICYTDILGHQTEGGGTIPPDILVTTLKPDIVIIDKKSKTLDIFELTVPGETRINIAHNLKSEKYQHFSTDIHNYKVSVGPFEIGSNTGYISRENKKTLAKLHTFCKKDTKLKHFTRNLSTIAVLSSYYLFNNRNLETWHTPSDFISTPMNIM